MAAGEKGATLFVDSFNGFFETENALAAAQLLQKAGYSVCLVGEGKTRHCCGRTFLACGMVDKAREKLAALIEDLLPLAQSGVAIVGLEPSCLLTLRDEALALGLGEKARIVAGASLLIEEFLSREAKAGRFKPALRPIGKSVLLHGHCHEKAFGAVDHIVEVLQLVPELRLELVEGSCCGMAGSFGYSHYDISMQMAELTLLPAVRSHPDALLLANGTSCRAQIDGGTGRKAIHIARLLNELC